MKRVEQLLGELVALPSVNPAFVPVNDPRAGERRVAEYLVAVLAQDGLDVALDEVLPGRPNVVARITPTGRMRHRVLLAPHLDTVGGEEPSIFQPRRRGKRLHGRGACDTKGSVAAMVTAVRDLARESSRPHSTEIVFAGLIDEENLQAGSRALARQRWKADLAIVGEPTALKVVTAHKGDLWLELATRGKAAHGARPHLGRNAVHAMARIIDTLETRYAAALRKRRHPLLGSPTINVGQVKGGTQPNIVPDHCTIQIDRRTLPGETESTVIRELRASVRSLGLKPDLVDLRGVPCPALETDPESPWVQRFMRSVGRRKPAAVDYFCDAAILSAGGIPSVVFGPGDIAQAHTRDEWIDLGQLDTAARLLSRFLKSLP